MYIALSMWGASEKPSTSAAQRAASNGTSARRSDCAQSRPVMASKASVPGSMKNRWRRYAAASPGSDAPHSVSVPALAGTWPASTRSSVDLPLPVSPCSSVTPGPMAADQSATSGGSPG